MSSVEDSVRQIYEAALMVSGELDADVILYSGEIKLSGYKRLQYLVNAFRNKPNVLLLLTTDGGYPDSAYRIARCLQRSYTNGELILFVVSSCKSAGTLLAIGADRVMMCESAELGPLDIQISKPDALAEQISGLTPSQAISTLCDQAFESMEGFFLALRFKSQLQITTRTALEIAANLTTGLFSPIFSQIDPMRLGEVARAMLIGEEYGKRLSKSGSAGGAVERLTRNYPSHGFVIDRDEATELLPDVVQKPTKSASQLAKLIRPLIEKHYEDEPLVEFLSELSSKPTSGSPPQGENHEQDSPECPTIPEATGHEATTAGGEGGAPNAVIVLSF